MSVTASSCYVAVVSVCVCLCVCVSRDCKISCLKGFDGLGSTFLCSAAVCCLITHWRHCVFMCLQSLSVILSVSDMVLCRAVNVLKPHVKTDLN